MARKPVLVFSNMQLVSLVFIPVGICGTRAFAQLVAARREYRLEAAAHLYWFTINQLD
jgi:hypothetical protein